MFKNIDAEVWGLNDGLNYSIKVILDLFRTKTK
jgi:hypothetical protein